MKPFLRMIVGVGLVLILQQFFLFAGEGLSKAAVKKVKAGMTPAEVLDLVGPPAEKKPRMHGGEVWTYRERFEKIKPVDAALPHPRPEKKLNELSLRVFFNSRGIAEKVKQKMLDQESRSRLVSKEEMDQELSGS